MAIPGLTEEELVDILNRELSASHPIRSPEHLFGREADLERIRNALAMDGRQVFIYGDRGVGKTSLAQTAAYRYQSADASPIITSCPERSTFESVMQDVVRKLRGGSTTETKRVIHHKEAKGASIAKGGFTINGSQEKGVQVEEGAAPSIKDANAAAAILKQFAGGHSEHPIVVVDEFDRMANEDERGKFADFLKQLGDQEVPVKFIFAGIADALDDLLDAHGSAHRYLDGIKVERINVSSRWDIIDKSAKALHLKVDNNVRHRIAAISDGFPYYVHLICEKLYFWVFHDDSEIKVITPEHLHHAIDETVLSIEHSIRRPYDYVMQSDDGDMLEPVMWAIADHSDLIRSQRSIYDSYCRIMEGLYQQPMCDREFTKALARLREKSCGVARLHKRRRGLNEFRENIFRGYVRLRAEAKGVSLALDYAPAPDPKRPITGKIKSGVNPIFQFPTFGRRGGR